MTRLIAAEIFKLRTTARSTASSAARWPGAR